MKTEKTPPSPVIEAVELRRQARQLASRFRRMVVQYYPVHDGAIGRFEAGIAAAQAALVELLDDYSDAAGRE